MRQVLIVNNSFSVSENPQTFNQALLLMASLARLAPEAVLLNIMPIFTFMGSNVFHRDDSYSFRVVQKVRYDSPFSLPPDLNVIPRLLTVLFRS